MKLIKAIKHVTDWAAYIAVFSLILLTLSIFYGVITRFFSFQDNYSYDISLYALVWFSMLGAGILARTGKNVTAGIAIENFVKTRFPIFPIIRSILVILIMAILFWASLLQTKDSFIAHETTMSIAQLPVWITKLAIVLGALAWIIGEIGRLMETVVSSK